MKKVNSNYNYSYENIAKNFETLDTAVKELNEKIPEDYSELQADVQNLQSVVGSLQGDVGALETTVNGHTSQISEVNTNLGYLSDTKANHFNEHIIKLSLTGAFIMDLSLRLITGVNIGAINTYAELLSVINNVYGANVEIPTSGTQLDTSNNNIIVVSSIYYDNATAQLVAKGLSTITMTVISQFGLGGCTVTDNYKTI